VTGGGEFDGQTPIDPNESEGLLLAIRTQEALNQAEEANILRARLWADNSRIVRRDLLMDGTLRRVHREMFGGVWRWAGTYRHSDKNIGHPWRQISVTVRQLCDNFVLRVSLPTNDRDELSVAFHHQLVSIHPFANGNGRHARFCADRLVENLGGEAFSWGRGDLRAEGGARARYLAALRLADSGDLEPLTAFARSGGLVGNRRKPGESLGPE
jgi:Fic-DOC domain mobile mystery protein B